MIGCRMEFMFGDECKVFAAFLVSVYVCVFGENDCFVFIGDLLTLERLCVLGLWEIVLLLELSELFLRSCEELIMLLLCRSILVLEASNLTSKVLGGCDMLTSEK